ncbi:MAG TPA: hypothetical protein VM513_34790 [Kofleriaceae bacterium]|jgi:hypothetical protein|nr:hypothetical protein [Kofleriaceae bacterium]
MTRLAVIFALAVAACGPSVSRVPLDNSWPAQPGPYYEVVDQWTRKAVLRGAYQEVLELAATLKSPAWRLAYADRDAQHRGLAGEAREQRFAQAKADAAGPWELELMVTTWDRRENDLDRGQKSIWKVTLLDERGNEIAPLEIVKDKRPAFVVRAEYPALGDFAQAYVVRFPREANILGPGVRQVRLRMSSARGGLTLQWDAP